MAKLSWNEFRVEHPGTEQSELSDLWKSYKDGEYRLETQSEDEVKSETVVETSHEEEAEDSRVVYNKLYSDCYLGNATPDEKSAMVKSLVTMAKEFGNLMPSDIGTGWTLWLGPCQWALLSNQGADYSFIVTRSWWNRLFSSPALVEQQVVDDEETLENIRGGFEQRQRLIKRYPIPRIEFNVPISSLDIPLSRVGE